MLLIFFITTIVFSLIVFFSKNRTVNNIIGTIFTICTALLSVYAFLNIDKTDSGFYKFDSLGVLFTFVLAILSFTTLYHSTIYLKRHNFTKRQESIYYVSLMMLIVSMISSYFAENIAIQWVSIEATTLFVSLLIYHERSEVAVEASWKYLFVSTLGVAIAFIGILFLTIIANKSNIPDLSIQNLVSVAKNTNPLWLKITFLLVVTGYSAKMGIFPLHTVTVDAHTAAPPPISAFISTTLMNVGFFGIFRIFTIIANTSILNWAQNVLFIVALLSLFMSSIQLLRVNHYKRMFAFSSLEHMGLVILGIAVGGIGYYAAILHLVFHSFTKASLFYQIDQAHSYYKNYWIKDGTNYMKINPLGAIAMMFAFISIIALPPSGLFITEILTFKALFLDKKIIIAILALIFLTVIIYAFGKNILHFLFGEKTKNEIEPVKFNPIETISQFLLLGLLVFLGFCPPQFFKDLINSAISFLN